MTNLLPAIAVEGLIDPFDCVEGPQNKGLPRHDRSLVTRKTQCMANALYVGDYLASQEDS